MNSHTKISIITVVRNGENHIEQTINSIINQTYNNIEYIIIDGGSTDNTKNIIRKYNERIDYWISEPDNGIYDAMNKGILASTGNWIIFINSDDFLANNNIINDSIPFLIESKNLVVYGKLSYILPSSEEIILGNEWEKIKTDFRYKSMIGISHQATFHSKELFRKSLYDTRYKLAADYDLLLNHLKTNEASFIPFIIAKMRFGGLSIQNYVGVFNELCHIYIKNSNYRIFFSKYWLSYFIKTYSHYISNKIFGPNLKTRIINSFTKFSQ